MYFFIQILKEQRQEIHQQQAQQQGYSPQQIHVNLIGDVATTTDDVTAAHHQVAMYEAAASSGGNQEQEEVREYIREGEGGGHVVAQLSNVQDYNQSYYVSAAAPPNGGEIPGIQEYKVYHN